MLLIRLLITRYRLRFHCWRLNALDAAGRSANLELSSAGHQPTASPSPAGLFFLQRERLEPFAIAL
jgi:hypothetical protein